MQYECKGEGDLHYQSIAPLVYSCPNPSVSLQGIVRRYGEGKGEDHVLDGQPQLVLQGLDVLVRWEVQSIEARVASWQLASVSVLFNGKPPRTVRTLKVLETVDWYPRGSGGELEKAGLLFWGPRTKDLPKPGDDLIFFIVATVVGELGPIVPGKDVSRRKKVRRRGYTHVDVGHSADQEFQFPLVKDADEVLGNDLEETVDESVKLFLDATDDPIMNGEVDVFAFILFGHWYVGPAGLEINGDEFAEPIFGDGKGFLQDAGDVVLTGFGIVSRGRRSKLGERDVQHPSQAPVKFLVDTLEVGDADLFTEDDLVETRNEEGVEEASVEDGHSDHAADKLEVGEMLGVDVGGWIDLKGVAVHGRISEQTVRRVEHVVRQEEEPFPRIRSIRRIIGQWR